MLHYDPSIPANVVEIAKLLASVPKLYDARFSERRARHVGVYYASDCWMCIRRHYWNFFDERIPSADNPEDLALMRFAANGNLHHQHVTNALNWFIEQQKLKKVSDETSIQWYAPEMQALIALDLERDIWISGRLDHLIVFPQLSLIIEVKSRDSVDTMNKPTLHHVPQLQLYMKCFHCEYGLFIYSARNDLKTRSFLIKADNEEIGRLLRRIVQLHYCVAAKIIPPPESKEPLNSRVWECEKFCEYKQPCDDLEAKKQKKL